MKRPLTPEEEEALLAETTRLFQEMEAEEAADPEKLRRTYEMDLAT